MRLVPARNIAAEAVLKAVIGAVEEAWAVAAAVVGKPNVISGTLG